MPRRHIRCLAVLAVLILSPLSAWAVDWQSDYAAALQQARTGRKLLIVEVRSGQCSACNDEMESPAEAVWNDPALAPQLAHYLFVRVPEIQARAAVSGLLASIDRQAKPPSITLADSSETALLVVKPRTQQVTKLTFAMMIIGDPAIRQVALSSAELRLAGKTAEADAGLGRVLMHLAQWKAAIEAFDSAARQFRVAGVRDEAQRSEIWTAFCWYRRSADAGVREAARNRSTGHGILANITRNPSTPEVEAQAWHIRGLLYLADASRDGSCCVVRPGGGVTLQDLERADRTIPGKDRRQAIEAFRKAYVIAPSGSPVIEAARTQLQAIDDQPLPRRADAQGRAAIRLLVPARRPLTGAIEVSLDSDVPLHSVDYFVDDLRAASSDSKPFTARIDLGNVPTLRTVKAIGRDADGNAVGEAVQTVNDRADALHVAITSPVKDAVPATVGVEAAVDVPAGRRLRSVEFFFNDVKFGALAEPPFRHALAVNGRFGYIRVIATLDDGTTGEDARLVNAGGQSDSVAVQGVTFIATVLDRGGRPFDGLQSSDFVVTEDGTRVETSAVNGAVEDPVTVGFAVDSSESMAIAMLFAKDLANRFFESSLRPNDRMFVVSFDTVPRLVQSATGRRGSAAARGWRAEPDRRHLDLRRHRLRAAAVPERAGKEGARGRLGRRRRAQLVERQGLRADGQVPRHSDLRSRAAGRRTALQSALGSGLDDRRRVRLRAGSRRVPGTGGAHPRRSARAIPHHVRLEAAFEAGRLAEPEGHRAVASWR